MFVVTKPATVRTDIINVTQILQVCHLSPRISGPALQGVTPETTLDRYNAFYINKYYSLDDFSFINEI